MAPKKLNVKVDNEKVAESTRVEQVNQSIDISKLVKGATVAVKLPDGSHYETTVLDVTVKDGMRQFTVAEKELVVTAAAPETGSDLGRKEASRVVKFTEALRDILTDDQDFILRQRKLVNVPARHTVQSIINDYNSFLDEQGEQRSLQAECSAGMSKTNATKDALKKTSAHLLDYFDATIGNMLLYDSERVQHSSLREQEKRRLMSETMDTNSKKEAPRTIRLSGKYGFVHLLRMFVRLGEILSYAPGYKDTILEHAQDLVLFLARKAPEYYDMKLDYIDATEQHKKSVFAERT
ncbi:Mortality factor 4 like 2 [Aphelenchoides avenae]|nr:Mortality factor 4 like 2 [Aphelenchus avenae]